MATFIQERGAILNDIDQFLTMVLRFLKKFKDADNLGDNLKNLHLLIESLCLIHGLYGYPAADGNTTDKEAVKVKLNGIIFEEKKFEDVYEKVKHDGFWTFRGELVDLNNLPREPAHLFLELVREILFEIDPEGVKAAKHGKFYLEYLPDNNKLKPTVWANHKNNPKLFGVSLGVRKFVRPLFIYVKLLQLRKHTDNTNSIDLSETEAFESICRNSVNFKRCSKYENVKAPCPSCRVFFGTFDHLNISIRNKSINFNIFGNCAEYDLIRTANLDSLLKQIAETGQTPWKTFELACKKQFDAFKDCIYSCENEAPKIIEYVKKITQCSKILKFQQSGVSFCLMAVDWHQPKSRKRKN